jgi:hypothetical protein
VTISTAIVTDVTSTGNRGKGMVRITLSLINQSLGRNVLAKTHLSDAIS